MLSDLFINYINFIFLELIQYLCQYPLYVLLINLICFLNAD